MKASAIFMTSIMFLATGIYSQQQYSAAKKFAETKERSGIDMAYTSHSEKKMVHGIRPGSSGRNSSALPARHSARTEDFCSL